MELEITIEDIGPLSAVVHLKGTIDTMTDFKFRADIFQLLDQGKKHLLLKMSGVSYISSSGLSTIIDVKRKLDSKGGTLSLFEPQIAVKRVLVITRLESWETKLENLDANNPFFEYVKAHSEKSQETN